ncbi:MAG: Gfo/Idh/MocA family protein [Clostridia bacterium]
MVRVGIIGSDGGDQSGHALGVCKILNKGRLDAEIVGLFGENEAETRALAASQGIDYIADRPEALLDRVDAVFVMPRNGNSHMKYALPFLEKGIGVFVDKPFTCTVSDAAVLATAANKSGAVLHGGSHVRYAPELAALQRMTAVMAGQISSGYLAFPVYLDSPYGGVHFYSHHLIEEMLTVFGRGVQSVTAVRVKDKLTVIAKYPDFPVIMNYAANYGGLHAGLYFDDGTAHMTTVQYKGCDAYQCALFLDAVQAGRGSQAEDLYLAVIISNAIVQSMESGREVYLKEVQA